MGVVFSEFMRAVTVIAIIYGVAYVIGFTVSLFKHRKELKEAVQKTEISGDAKAWLWVLGMFGLVFILKQWGA